MAERVCDSDLLVIGGGLIGCAIAWEAAQRGLRVTVIERDEVGWGATHAAGGMLAPLAEADGESPFLRICCRSAELYPGFVAKLRDTVGLDVEYRTEGTIFVSLNETDDEELESRFRWQRDCGMNIERLSRANLLGIEPSLNPEVRWALLFPNDHQVNNRRLIKAVYAAACSAGVEFRTNTNAERLLIRKDGGHQVIRGVQADGKVFEAEKVVIAAGSWSSRIAETPETGIVPIRGQMVAVRNAVPPVRHTIYSRRGYLVPRLDGRLIAGSTTENAGFECLNTAGGISTVITNALEIMPGFANQPIVETWAGLRPRAADHLPVIGPDASIRGLIHATGHYRNGILLAPLTALVVGDLLTGSSPEIDLTPFLPSRLMI